MSAFRRVLLKPVKGRKLSGGLSLGLGNDLDSSGRLKKVLAPPSGMRGPLKP